MVRSPSSVRVFAPPLANIGCERKEKKKRDGFPACLLACSGGRAFLEVGRAGWILGRRSRGDGQLESRAGGNLVQHCTELPAWNQTPRGRTPTETPMDRTCSVVAGLCVSRGPEFAVSACSSAGVGAAALEREATASIRARGAGDGSAQSDLRPWQSDRPSTTGSLGVL